MASTEVKVPDIGDFKEVEVVEILVKPGDSVAKEQSLISLESDKATMEIPSPSDGVVRELKLKVGDKVSKGSLILLLEGQEAVEKPKASTPSAAPSPFDRGASQTSATSADIECDVLVLGSGPG